jgi:hypothetical protein
MASKRPKRPKDFSQAAKLVIDIATGQASEAATPPDSPAVEFARSGGLKGGRARADALTPQRRREIALNAAKKRWRKPGGQGPGNKGD